MAVFDSDRMHDAKAVKRTPENPKICHCNYCGEYLGDIINGKLWKFGKLITKLHKCKRRNQSILKDKDMKDLMREDEER